MDTGALGINWEDLDEKQQERIKGNVITTRLRNWRSKQVKRNRLLYHTKRIMLEWCECVDEGAQPCKIIQDLLKITPKELEHWKGEGSWPWMQDTPSKNSSLEHAENLLKLKKHQDYKNHKVRMCQMGNTLDEKRPQFWTMLLPPLPNEDELLEGMQEIIAPPRMFAGHVMFGMFHTFQALICFSSLLFY